MQKMWIPVFATCLGLSCPETPVHAALLSATGPVVAILSDELFVGQAEGHLNGSGTLAIHSQQNPDLICVGQFTSDASQGGSGQLQCSDGASANFYFQRLSVWRGYGSGSFSRGAMSFAYGFSAADAGPYLKLPAGKTLAYNGKVLKLADR